MPRGHLAGATAHPDSKHADLFDTVLASERSDVIRSLAGAPNANAFCLTYGSARLEATVLTSCRFEISSPPTLYPRWSPPTGGA
jgi:hypothetical protein